MSATATFVLLSFEGPDPYANAGGLGSRVTDLSSELAAQGYQTHLFFIGDPGLPGHEVRQGGRLHLHRWCQWISQYHPHGVYDGEEGKIRDWDQSLPGWLETNVLEQVVSTGNPVVVMAEEWHTARSIIELHRIIEARGWQDQVFLVWNANNPFGFHRIPWAELRESAVITTVSRYMRTLMQSYQVEARVVPNGIKTQWLEPADGLMRMVMNEVLAGRTSLTKVARWDPDKGWAPAVEAVTIMKRMGMRPLLFARGGLEGYGQHILRHASTNDLDVRHVKWDTPAFASMIEALRPELEGDVVVLDSPLTLEQRRALFSGTNAVLANSGREPFGLVGLETMAAGGVAMVGCSGEDYSTAGHDSISLQTSNPWEIVHNVAALQDSPLKSNAMRKSARRSAARYTWELVINRCLLPILEMGGVYGLDLQAKWGEPAVDLPVDDQRVTCAPATYRRKPEFPRALVASRLGEPALRTAV